MKKLFAVVSALFLMASARLTANDAPASSQQEVQMTFSMIKPHAVKEHHIGAIIDKIEQAGLRVAALRLYQLSKTEAETFYQEHKGKPFYPGLVEKMTSGPIVLMVISGTDAVTALRKLIGSTDPSKAEPGTIRKLFAKNMTENAIHASDSPQSAEREIAFFFSDDQIYQY